MIQTSDTLWPELAKVLGLEGVTVTKAVITFEPNKLVIIDITTEIGTIEGGEFGKEFKQYKLIEAD